MLSIGLSMTIKARIEGQIIALYKRAQQQKALAR